MSFFLGVLTTVVLNGKRFTTYSKIKVYHVYSETVITSSTAITGGQRRTVDDKVLETTEGRRSRTLRDGFLLSRDPSSQVYVLYDLYDFSTIGTLFGNSYLPSTV